jgi:hypothetical protein
MFGCWAVPAKPFAGVSGGEVGAAPPGAAANVKPAEAAGVVGSVLRIRAAATAALTSGSALCGAACAPAARAAASRAAAILRRTPSSG